MGNWDFIGSLFWNIMVFNWFTLLEYYFIYLLVNYIVNLIFVLYKYLDFSLFNDKFNYDINYL